MAPLPALLFESTYSDLKSAMQEAGVSKIVSVKMAQDARDEAFEESEEESASEELTQEVRTGEASGDEGMTLTEEL